MKTRPATKLWAIRRWLNRLVQRDTTNDQPKENAGCDLSASAGSEFLYVRVEVLPADPDHVMLLNGLVEKTSGQPMADIVPHTDPGSISFHHARLIAANEDDAYLRGWDLLPAPQNGAVINDYVVRL